MKFSCCSVTDKELKDLMNDKYTEDNIIEIFKILSHPMRLKMLQVMLVEGEVCTCEFVNLFNKVQPLVTKQLSKMKKAGLLSYRKVNIVKDPKTNKYVKKESKHGKWTYYKISDDKLSLIQQLLSPFMDESKISTLTSKRKEKDLVVVL